MTDPDPDPTGEPRAWGWVDHLRAGGTTPWAAWSGTAEPSGRAVPGAQQLELLRRLNEVGSPDPRLVERVLATSAPGRGQPDLELVGAAHDSRFGPPAIDPALPSAHTSSRSPIPYTEAAAATAPNPPAVEVLWKCA